MKFHFPTVAFVCALLACCGKTATKQQVHTSGESPLATVGGTSIFAADLRAEAERRMKEGIPLPGKDELLEQMVREEALVQQALAQKLDQDPEVRRTMRSLLVGAMTRSKLDPAVAAVKVEQAEVEAFYAANEESFHRQEQVRLAVIFASAPAVAPPEAVAGIQARMDESRAVAVSGPDGFREAAAKFSEHQGSRYRSGEIGWITREQPPRFMPGEVVDAACGLKENEVSPVIRAGQGFYIVRLLGRQAAGTRPLPEVEAQIRSRLLDERRAAVRRNFYEDIHRTAGVRTHPELLSSVVLPEPPPISSPVTSFPLPESN